MKVNEIPLEGNFEGIYRQRRSLLCSYLIIDVTSYDMIARFIGDGLLEETCPVSEVFDLVEA